MIGQDAVSLALSNATERGAELTFRKRVYAARREVQDMFPDDVIEVMTDINGRITFERRPYLNRT